MNMGSCGSAGCSLYLFAKQSDGRFVQVLGTQGGVGHLEQVKLLSDVTKGHYDIQKIWADGKTKSTYRWNGIRYSEE